MSHVDNMSIIDSLNDHEADTIILMALATGPKTEEELERILDWAESVRFHARLLSLVLDRKVGVAWNGTEVTFTHADDLRELRKAQAGDRGVASPEPGQAGEESPAASSTDLDCSEASGGPAPPPGPGADDD